MVKVSLYARQRGSRKRFRITNPKKELPLGTVFIIRYSLNGKRVWETLDNIHTIFGAEGARKTKEAALITGNEIVLKSWKQSYSVQRKNPVKPQPDAPHVLTLKPAIDRYLQDVRLKSQNTQDVYQFALEQFLASYGDKPITKITKQDLVKFQGVLVAQGLSDRTIHNRVSAVVVFLRHNGIKDIRLKIKYTDKIVSAYRPDELDALFAHATPPEWLLFQFFLCTGMRYQEVQNVEFRDVDFRSHLVKVSEKEGWKPKDREEREIPIPDYLIEALKIRMANSGNAGRIFSATRGGKDERMLNKLQALAKRAGLAGEFGLHKFRKSYATLQHRAGVDARTIQKRLGHSDLATTLAYLEAEDARSERSRNQANETFGRFAQVPQAAQVQTEVIQ